MYKLTSKERKLVKEYIQSLKESVIDYEDEIVSPSWLIKGKEYVWIMGAEPLLVVYTGSGKRPGSKNFKFVNKPNINHDLSPRDVKEYIRYKKGDLPGPFGPNDGPLGGLNKFKGGPFESKKIKRSIIKENNTYTMLSALRDILDDLMVNTEMLIDNSYGKISHEDFKKKWYKYTSDFEAKFKNIQKNLISAAKK